MELQKMDFKNKLNPWRIKTSISKIAAEVLAKLLIASTKDKLCSPANQNSSFFCKPNHKLTVAITVNDW